jgi:glyoxylase I family protein
MRLEHVALNVPDVRAMAAWYVEHLGMKIASEGDSSPHATFVTDSAGRSMLELYTWEDPTPPQWSERDRYQLHLAFLTDDLDADRDRLVAAGATIDGDPVHNPVGDVLLFLRDPWGVAFQIVSRAVHLLKE